LKLLKKKMSRIQKSPARSTMGKSAVEMNFVGMSLEDKEINLIMHISDDEVSIGEQSDFNRP